MKKCFTLIAVSLLVSLVGVHHATNVQAEVKTNVNKNAKEDELVFSFSVISDFQLTLANVPKTRPQIENALQDLHELDPNQEAMVVVGDIVDDSFPENYNVVKDIMEKNPHPDNLFYVIGNHEYDGFLISKHAKEQFLNFAELDSVYYEREVNGTHLLYLDRRREA